MKNFIFFITFCFYTSCVSFPEKIIIENDHFKYEINQNGDNIGFVFKLNGNNYLDTKRESKCAFVKVDDNSFNASFVEKVGDKLEIRFGENRFKVFIDLVEVADRVIFRVDSVSEQVDELVFLNIPLNLEAQPYEQMATCALSMNLFTHVRLLPPLQNHLWAKCYKRFGIIGAEVTILGLPQDMLLPTIRNVITHSENIPFSDEGGAWALMKDEGFGSYLMNFGTLTEENVDEWIDKCKDLGFNQIDSHGGGDFFEFGTFELNRKKWPDGWESFKRINARLHEAGISHIFHTYAFFIDKNSEYVSPVPHKDLGYVGAFTLKESIGENDTELIVNEPTSHISTVTGFHTENSVTLRIGDELIEFSGVTKSAPYKLLGLKRGANGTHQEPHSINDTAFHLSERFGRFVPGPETKLFDKMAKTHADIINNCDFDGLYLDAIDGSAVLGGEENFWYYGTKFIFEIAKNLERPVGMEMSSMGHHWWHYRSRWQAWDRPVRGYKRFIDIHLASIKAPSLFLLDTILSNEWEHGRWPGHSVLINKYAGIKNGQTLLPLHLGWWSNQTWNPPQIEPTFPDDIEYLGCKMIANDAGFSQLGGVDEITLNKYPLYRQSMEIIKKYEVLRKQDYFSDSIKSILRQPGKEFTLFQQSNGIWNFRPVTYEKHKVIGVDPSSRIWEVNNGFESQPVKLRIEVLMSAQSYNDPSGIVLTDFSSNEEFDLEHLANGISGNLKASIKKLNGTEPTGDFLASNLGQAESDASYVCMTKNFKNQIDLNRNKALGVWVKGDGNGQLLNLSLRSPDHLSHGAHGDHFITVDFEGWKYFELVEIESSRISDYVWPDDSRFYVYDSYRHRIDFSEINKLQLWYNNIPKGESVKCNIGPIKALPMVPSYVENPSVTINGKEIIFPIRMESGMFLEFRSVNDCKLFGSRGELIAEVNPEGAIPTLLNGDNKISVLGEGSDKVEPRLQVTIISEGSPLNEK